MGMVPWLAKGILLLRWEVVPLELVRAIGAECWDKVLACWLEASTRSCLSLEPGQERERPRGGSHTEDRCRTKGEPLVDMVRGTWSRRWDLWMGDRWGVVLAGRRELIRAWRSARWARSARRRSWSAWTVASVLIRRSDIVGSCGGEV